MKGEAGNTKQRIIVEAMKLFSVNGYDAVSIRDISAAVGISNGALYRHFTSKQEIFDMIVNASKERYLNKCENLVTETIRGVKQVKKVCLDMFNYQTGDEWIVMFRKMLILEQFKNQQMAALYKEFFIDIPLAHQAAIFRKLIARGMMKDKDASVMAMELYAPFFMYHSVHCDTETLAKQFETHVEYFLNNYVTEKSDTNADK